MIGEDSYKSIFENVPVGLYRTTTSGQIVLVNPAMAKMLGYPSVESLRALNSKDFYANPEDRESWQKTVVDKTVVHNYEVRWRRKDNTTIWVKNSTTAVHDEQGRILYYEGAVEDVTPQHELKELAMAVQMDWLQEKDELYLKVLNTLPVYATRKDRQHRITFANRLYCEAEAKRPLADVRGKTDFDFYLDDLAEKYQEDDQKVFETGKVFETIEEHETKQGHRRLVHVVKAPIRDLHGHITGVQCLWWDEEGHEEAMVALHQTIGEVVRYRSLVADTFAIVYEHDMQGRFLSMNEEGQRVTGYSEKDLPNLRIEDIVVPEHVARVREKMRAKLEAESPQTTTTTYELDITTKQGVRLPLEISSRLIYQEGKPVRVQGHGRDISEKRSAEEQRLKEIHHRIKNNLQVVSSLLSLESDKIDDERIKKAVETVRENPAQASAHIEKTLHQLKEVFIACQNRVQTMALIHKLLYQSKDLARINLATYVRSLGAYLKESYSANKGEVTLKYQLDDEVMVGLDTAVPCGLIINELVSNALKYAFPQGRRGEVRVNLYSTGGGYYRLHIIDNGTGMPRDFVPREHGSLGTRLVYDLVERQLKGNIELARHHGTAFTITFQEVEHS